MGLLKPHHRTWFLQYCENGNFEKLLLLSLEENRKDFEYGLYLSARDGHFKIVKYLLDNNTDPNYEKSIALHVAAAYDHYEVVKLLLDRGANPEILSVFGKNAVYNAKGRSLKLLIELGTSVQLPDDLIEHTNKQGNKYYVVNKNIKGEELDEILLKTRQYYKYRKKYIEILEKVVSTKHTGPEVSEYIVQVFDSENRVFLA